MGVDIMMIKKFCTACFSDWKNNNFTSPLLIMLKEVISKNPTFNSSIELFCMITNIEEFTCTFQLICNDLFQYGGKPQYIVTLIAFCLQLDVHMQSLYSWYQTDMLIDLLCDVLQKIDFNPCTLSSWNNIWRQYYYYTILVFVSTIFLCYYCSK